MNTQRFIVIDEDGLPIRKFYRRIDAKLFVQIRPEMQILVNPKVDVFSKMFDDIGQAPF
jgi:hypothetical protein